MEKGEAAYRRYISGDSDAFGEVLDIYRDSLIFFINRFVKCEDIAEELAADCFTELIIHPKRYNFSVSLKTYLFTIAHHKAVNYIRRSIKIRFIPLENASVKSTEYLDFEEKLFKEENKRLLNESLFKLKDDYRTVLHLIYFEEMSYKDAAKVMKKSVKQIDNLVQRAKLSLKNILQKEGFEYAE